MVFLCFNASGFLVFFDAQCLHICFSGSSCCLLVNFGFAGLGFVLRALRIVVSDIPCLLIFLGYFSLIDILVV